VSSDSIVKGIIDDIIKTAVKTAEVDEQKTKRKHEKVISQLYKVTTVLSAYKYAPNLESLLTQQYICVMCTL
jgi:hypothetical protein